MIIEESPRFLKSYGVSLLKTFGPAQILAQAQTYQLPTTIRMVTKKPHLYPTCQANPNAINMTSVGQPKEKTGRKAQTNPAIQVPQVPNLIYDSSIPRNMDQRLVDEAHILHNICISSPQPNTVQWNQNSPIQGENHQHSPRGMGHPQPSLTGSGHLQNRWRSCKSFVCHKENS